jgi:hypothetical protein
MRWFPTKPNEPSGAIWLKQFRANIEALQLGRFHMTATIIRTIAKGSARVNSDFETLATLGLFSGFGLLISVGVVVLDKYMPGEWF